MNDTRIRALMTGLVLAQGSAVVAVNALFAPSVVQLFEPTHGWSAYLPGTAFLLASAGGVLLLLLAARGRKPIWLPALYLLGVSCIPGFAHYLTHRNNPYAGLTLPVVAALHVVIVYAYRGSPAVRKEHVA